MSRRQRRWLAISLALGAAAWLPTASSLLLIALFHNGMDLFRGFRDAPNAWAIPFAAFFYWRDFSATPSVAENLSICAWAAAAFCAFPAGYVATAPRRPNLTPARPGQEPEEAPRARSDVHGRADWLPMPEVRRLYARPNPKWGGLVVGTASRHYDPTAPLLISPCEDEATHGVVIAGSGGYKTSSVTIPCLDQWIGSVVTFDPAGQAGDIAASRRRDMGHDVRMIAPLCDGFDALGWIDPDDPLAESYVMEVLDWIGGDIRSKSSGENAVFVQGGRELEAAILADMLWDITLPRSQRTLREFRHRVRIPENRMKPKLQDIEARSRSALARDYAGQLMGTHQKTFSGVYKHATTETAWLSIAPLADMVSGNDFDPAKLTAGKTSLFVQVPESLLRSSPGIARTVIGSLVKTVYLANGQVSGRVLMLCDEARFLGRLQVVDEVLAAGRKHGMTLVTMWPTIGSMKKIWGEEGVADFIGNAAWCHFAAIGDPDTAKYISGMSGSHGVLAYSEGNSRSNSMSGSQGRSSGRNWGVSEAAKKLMTEDEVLAMPAKEAIVSVRGHGRFRCGRAVYFERPDMRDRFGKDRYQIASGVAAE